MGERDIGSIPGRMCQGFWLRERPMGDFVGRETSRIQFLILWCKCSPLLAEEIVRQGPTIHFTRFCICWKMTFPRKVSDDFDICYCTYTTYDDEKDPSLLPDGVLANP
jgi:hypothetical protein